MQFYRELKTLRRIHPRQAVGKWVIEFSLLKTPYAGAGWRTFGFGVYKIVKEPREGEYFHGFRNHNLKGFRRAYLFWFPFERED